METFGRWVSGSLTKMKRMYPEGAAVNTGDESNRTN
jgi:hypothetical protein